jgi:hypothetical protein
MERRILYMLCQYHIDQRLTHQPLLTTVLIYLVAVRRSVVEAAEQLSAS